MLALGLAPAAPRCAEPRPRGDAPACTRSLYQRLGGYDSLAVLTDDFVGRLTRDRTLSRYFSGVSDESKGRIRQLLLDQLCAASGGPCIYPGRDMKCHAPGPRDPRGGLGADRRAPDASLDKYKVGPKEKDEVLQWVARLKRDIVEKP
jgi:hemoglobin